MTQTQMDAVRRIRQALGKIVPLLTSMKLLERFAESLEAIEKDLDVLEAPAEAPAPK